MTAQNYKIIDAMDEIKETVKAYHCVTALLSTASPDAIDMDNLKALLNVVGNQFQAIVLQVKAV